MQKCKNLLIYLIFDIIKLVIKMNIFNYLTLKADTFYLDYKCTIRQALEKLDYYKFTIIPLIDKNGRYVSTISVGDILRFIKNNCNFDLSLAENITLNKVEKYRPYKHLTISSKLTEVYNLSLEQNFIPIVDDRNMFIGIIKRKDVIKYIYEKYQVLD